MNFFKKDYVKRLVSLFLVLVMVIGTMQFTITADTENDLQLQVNQQTTSPSAIDVEMRSLSGIVPAGMVRVYFDMVGGTWEAGAQTWRDFPLGTPISEVVPYFTFQYPPNGPGTVARINAWLPPDGETYLTEPITLTASWVVDITFAANPYISGDEPATFTIPLNTSLQNNGITLPDAVRPAVRLNFIGWFDVPTPGMVIDWEELLGPGNKMDEHTVFGSSISLHARWSLGSWNGYPVPPEPFDFDVITIRFNHAGGNGILPYRAREYEFALLDDGTIIGLQPSTFSPYYLNRDSNGNRLRPNHHLINGPTGTLAGFNLVTLVPGTQPNSMAYQEWFTEPDGQGRRPFVTGQELSSAAAIDMVRYLHENHTDPNTGFIELYASWFYRVQFHENPAPAITGPFRDIRRRDAGGTLATHGVAVRPDAGEYTANPEVFGVDLPPDPEPLPGRIFRGWYNLPIIDYNGETWVNQHPQIPNPDFDSNSPPSPSNPETINHPLISNTIVTLSVLNANDAHDLIPRPFTVNTPINNTMIAFARWEVESAVELRFHSNGGTFRNNVDTIVRAPDPTSGSLHFTTPAGNLTHRTPPIPSRPGYVFMGWFESPDTNDITVMGQLIQHMWFWSRNYSDSPLGSVYNYYARWEPAVRINLWLDAPLPPNDIEADVPTAFRYGVAGRSFRQIGQVHARSQGHGSVESIHRDSDHTPIDLPRLHATRPGGFVTLIDQSRVRGGLQAGIPTHGFHNGVQTPSAFAVNLPGGLFSTARGGHGAAFNVDTMLPADTGSTFDLYAIWTSALTFNNNQTSAGLSVDTIEGVHHRAVINSTIPEDRFLSLPFPQNWPWISRVLIGGAEVFMNRISDVVALTERPFVNVPGHAFRGWNTQRDGQGDWFTITTNVFGDQTVYAQWFNGAVFNPGLPSQGVPEYVILPDDSRHYIIQPGDREREIDSPNPIPNFPPDPVWPGNTFRLWVDIDGTPVTATRPIFGAIEIFALWSGSITFDANGGTLANPADGFQLVPFLENPTPAFPADPSRTGGWQFAGWNTEQDGSGDEFTDADPVVTTRTIYAQWDGNITFDLNGGNVDGDITIAARTIRDNAAFGTMPNAVRLGYNAPTWEIVGGTLDGTVVDAETLMTMGNVTVIAVWVRSPRFTVSYAHATPSPRVAPPETGRPVLPGNHTNLLAGQSVTAVNLCTPPVTVVVTSGPDAGTYTFAGWTASGAVTGDIAVGAQVTIPAGPTPAPGNVTLTARWTFEAAISYYQVSYRFTGHLPLPAGAPAVPTSRDIAVGTTVTPTAMSSTSISGTRNGVQGTWTFGGWTSSHGTSFEMPNENVEFTGNWTFTPSGSGTPSDNLSISKFADIPNGSHVVVGQTVTYTIRVRNDGDISANNVAIRDIIPAGMTFVSDSAITRINGSVVVPPIIPNISGNTLAWNIPTLAAGQTVEVSFQVTVNPLPVGIFERTFRNTAQVNGNNTNSVNLVMTGLIKQPDRMAVYVGETINWTLRGFHNPLDRAATNFAIIDAPGRGLNFQSGSLPAFVNGAGVTYDIRYQVVGSNEWRTHATDINANSPFTFSLPQPGDLYYTAIGLFFGDVPVGFGLGNEIVLTFVVGDNAPNNILTNGFMITFDNAERPGISPDEPVVNEPGIGGGAGGSVRDASVESIIPFNPAHHAYMVGDANGMIRPNASITRAEVATIFFRLVTDDYRAQMWTQQNSFADVQMNHWFNNAVSTMANAGVLTGMPDGTFQPQRAITRAEFAVVMARFFEGLPMEGANMFPDIEGHWAAAEINAAARMGWITGFPNGNFAPNQAITRAEAAALINRILGRLPRTVSDLLPGMTTWADNANTNAWYYLYIQEASNSNEFVMQADGIHKTWTALLNPRDWQVLEYPSSRPLDIIGQYRTLSKMQPMSIINIHRQVIAGR